MCESCEYLIGGESILNDGEFPWQKIHTIIFYEQYPTITFSAYLTSLLTNGTISSQMFCSIPSNISNNIIMKNAIDSLCPLLFSDRFRSEYPNVLDQAKSFSIKPIIRNLSTEDIIIDEQTCVN